MPRSSSNTVSSKMHLTPNLSLISVASLTSPTANLSASPKFFFRNFFRPLSSLPAYWPRYRSAAYQHPHGHVRRNKPSHIADAADNALCVSSNFLKAVSLTLQEQQRAGFERREQFINAEAKSSGCGMHIAEQIQRTSSRQPQALQMTASNPLPLHS